MVPGLRPVRDEGNRRRAAPARPLARPPARAFGAGGGPGPPVRLGGRLPTPTMTAWKPGRDPRTGDCKMTGRGLNLESNLNPSRFGYKKGYLCQSWMADKPCSGRVWFPTSVENFWSFCKAKDLQLIVASVENFWSFCKGKDLQLIGQWVLVFCSKPIKFLLTVLASAKALYLGLNHSRYFDSWRLTIKKTDFTNVKMPLKQHTSS